MNSYNFRARFLSSFFNMGLVLSAVYAAVNAFNVLHRKSYKRLTVTPDPVNKHLDFTLVSAIPIDPINYLRASQYFSKQLSLQPGMAAYIVAGRMLEQF